MKKRTFKLHTPQGIPQYEDFVDTDGACELVRFLYYHEGVRNERINSMIAWLETMAENPTKEQFMNFMRKIGAEFIPANEENIDN